MKTRIAVIGVPGSGKTKFASSLKRALPEYNFSILDGYAEKLQQKLNMSLGVEATYLPNVHISSVREQEIRKMILEDKDFIVCGTMFDTLCYAGFHAEMIANASGSVDEKNGVLMREITAAQLFAYLTIDSFVSFSHIFYLPVTDPELLVAITNKDDPEKPPGEVESLDKTIQDALRRYGSPATILSGKHSKNVQKAVEIIKSGKNGTDNNTDPVAGE
jgi:energy-coupling factor transporter ATP-binding protein EcfA2